MDTEEFGTTGSELVPGSAPLGVLQRCSATPMMICCRVSSFSLNTIAWVDVVGADVVWLKSCCHSQLSSLSLGIVVLGRHLELELVIRLGLTGDSTTITFFSNGKVLNFSCQ